MIFAGRTSQTCCELVIVPVRGLLQRLVRHSLLRDNGNGVNLHKKIRIGQSCNKEHRDRRRVGSVAPRVPECFKARQRRLAMHDVHIPLDDVLQLRPACRQGGFQVLEHLLVWALMSPLPTIFPETSTAFWPPT
jgi:hypothetical protein